MIDMAKSAAVSEVRAWAKSNGYDIGDRGRLPVEVWDAWAASQPAASKRGARSASASAEPSALTIDPSELRQAQDRIGQLETHVQQLAARLEKVEMAAAQPTAAKRRFARSR